MRYKSLLAVLVLLWGTIAVLAQEDRGRISGLVTDPSGAVIPKATVTLMNEETNVVMSKDSNEAGAYVFEYVIPGLYTISTNADGFKEMIVEHVRVEVAAHVGIPFKLEVGAKSESVTVHEQGVSLHTEDSTLGTVVEGRSMQELPILYGNPFELQLLLSGVASTSLSTGNHTYEGGSESAKVNGAQSGQTEFTLDGAPDTRNGGAVTTAYVPSRDFVQEFKFITSPYDASIAHTSGASLDTSIKSGTNNFHGGASWFYQNSEVNAPNYNWGTNVAPAQTRYNRESAEVNGPIFRQKLFFFGGYERQNSSIGNSQTLTVPTAAEKNGDFSALLGLQAGKQQTCSSRKYTVDPYSIGNPFTTTPDTQCSGHFTRQLYSGNVIPASQINPIATKILSYYPTATGSSAQTADGQNNYVWNGATVDHYWNVATRVDYSLSANQKLFAHYITSDRQQPGKNAYYPNASGQTLTLKNNGVVLDYVNILNALTVLNVRYSFTRFTTVTSLDAKTTAVDLGLPANVLAGSNPQAHGFPQVKISGYGTLENSDPGYEADNIHTGVVSISRSQGIHQIHFGVEWRQYQANQANFTQEHLSLSTSGTYTKGPEDNSTAAPIGQALASFLVGIPENTAMTLNAATSNYTDYYSAFIQDDWKILPRLTINAGIRYEYGSPIWERNNKSITGFAFNAANPVAAQAMANYAAHPSSLLPASQFKVNGGLLYAGTSSNPAHGLWQSQKKNFSPRFGFAYSVNPKLVVRGGAGIFFSHLGEYVQYGNPTGYSQTTNITVTNNNGQSYIATLANPFPNGLVQPSANSNGMLQGLGTSITFFPQQPKNPYNERWSLGFQYALPGEIVLDANYVGNNNYHIKITRDYDPLPNQYLSPDQTLTAAQNNNNTTLTASNITNPFLGISAPGSPALFTSSTTTLQQLYKQYPEYTGITSQDTSGYSSYHALQVSLTKRFSHGYNMLVSYTQSKSLDAITFLNAGDVKPWYGVSNGDYPRVLSVASIYELPFGPGKLFGSHANRVVAQAIRGWQIQGLYRVQSGQPITFSTNNMVLNSGFTYNDIGKVSNRSITQWFNKAAFDTASADQLKLNLRVMPLRFNNVRQDYQNLLNAGISRKFQVTERVSTNLRFEAINALNHPVFSAPSTTPTSTSFGQITSVGNSPRYLQFAVEGHF